MILIIDFLSINLSIFWSVNLKKLYSINTVIRAETLVNPSQVQMPAVFEDLLHLHVTVNYNISFGFGMLIRHF